MKADRSSHHQYHLDNNNLANHLSFHVQLTMIGNLERIYFVCETLPEVFILCFY